MLSTSAKAKDVSAKVSILDAIRFVAKSWRQLKAQTIANCFRKGGFRVVTASEESTESREPASEGSDEEQTLPEVANGDCYLRVDDDLQCYNEDDTLEEDIVEAVSSKRPCLEDGSEQEDSDCDDDVAAKITHAAARRSIQVLQQYFIEQGFNEAHYTALDVCADGVLKNAASKTKQTTLDSFVV